MTFESYKIVRDKNELPVKAEIVLKLNSDL